jgi:peptidoglycan/xylan/chitin deacetylase (PgdA/CDA1 family)
LSSRDLVGYGRTPPHPRWPGDARLALNFVVNFEEGAERSFPDGDGVSEVHGTEVSASPVPTGTRDLAAESMFEYGSRAGWWRLVRLFEERRLPFTVFGCALALERNPEAAAWIRDSHTDVCAHGRRWTEHFRMEEDQERVEIAAAVASIARTTGEPPRGWYCRYGPSTATRRLLVAHGGFEYDSDAYNDDLPWWTRVDGAAHLVVPYTQVNNDIKLARGTIGTGAQFEAMLRDAVDLLCLEGESAPRMMSVGLHCRIVGHPSRAGALARFLDHVAGHPQVWVARRVDIARHWKTVHPAPEAAA